MPIYEYECGSCGTRREVLQKMSDAPLTDCPSCGEPALQKLVSAAGFQLKGSGWYATDFRGGAKGVKGGGKDEPKIGDEAKPKEGAKTEPACGAGACPACQ
jgi:putative FmdB family regulatory protein